MKRQIFLTGLVICILSTPAHAYIDPGSGSALISIIVGAFVAAGLALKTFWYKITGVFTGKKAPNDNTKSED